MPRWFKWLDTSSTGRWPATTDEWASLEKDFHRRIRQACIDVARDIGQGDLAKEMEDHSGEPFPAAEFLQELNNRSRGAGNRAFDLARKGRNKA